MIKYNNLGLILALFIETTNFHLSKSMGIGVIVLVSFLVLHSLEELKQGEKND